MSKVKMLGILSIFFIAGLIISCTVRELFTESALPLVAKLSPAPVPSIASMGVPGTFVGKNSQILSIWIEPGVWIFRVVYKGDSGFSARLYDWDGKLVKDMRQESPSGLASVSISQGRAGLYRLEIFADGSWAIDVRGCTCSAESE